MTSSRSQMIQATKKLKRKFIDSLRIHVKGGSGGNGYPKFGGIGGSGGDVYLVGDKEANLKDVLKGKEKRASAGHGENSNSRKILGQKGSDLKIKVPTGITILSETGRKIGEINDEAQEVLVATGGIGGCESTGFCGIRSEGKVITLDLKLIADVALVGLPNAGKSTLLSIISKAKPKIASYPFTTLEPNIGVIEYPDLRTISVADLPGLIEGAHANIGLGHKFLKHVERTKILLVVVDLTGFKLGFKYKARSFLESIILLNKELELYKEELLNKPAMLVANKMDLPGAKDTFSSLKDSLNNLEDLFPTVPENLRPVQALNFKKILAISASNNDPDEINQVKNSLRETIDLEEETDFEAELKLAKIVNSKYKVHGPSLI